jgi:diguanylate cyclase (GGDEF)-like protein/PAS domain S-box-containing protein
MRFRAPLLFALVALLAAAGIGYYFHANFRSQARHVARQNLVALDVAYRASVSMYRLDVETRLKNQILREEILDLLERANAADANQLPLIRGLLYRALRTEYRDMAQAGLWQLHFHFPDGRSLLRFHSPGHWGDASLFDIRPSIRIANTELRPANGFEGGRVLPGFRNVYPILRAGGHLGSVEVSLPFELIHQSLLDLLPRGDYTLLLHRDTVDLVFEDQRDKFSPAEVHPDYFKENPEISHVNRAFALSETGHLLNAVLRQQAATQRDLATGDSFATHVLSGGRGYIASFHAIQDLQGKHAAYVVGYNEAPVLIGIRDTMLREAAIVFILLGALALSGWTLIRHRQRLADEKNRLQTITETMSDGLYVIDTHGATVFVNHAACELTGYAKEDLLGRIAHDLFHNHAHNEDQPATQCPIIRAAQTGDDFHGEEWFISQSGRSFPVEVSCRALVEHGSIVGTVILFRDISAARATLERLRLQGAALDAAANAIVITDVEANIEWTNPAFSELSGYPAHEALGSKPKELVRSGLQPIELYQNMWQTILSGKSWQGELINRKKNGELYDEAMTITPVRDIQGQIRHFIAIKQDITQRKREEAAAARAQAEIERLAARNQLLLNSAGDGIYGTDANGLCTFINPAALSLLGYAREEVIGGDSHALFHHHHADGRLYPHAECPIHLTQSDGQYRNVEDAFIRKNGEPFDVNLSVTPIIEAERNAGVVVVFQDITSRKRMQAELQRLATTDTLTGIANRRQFMRQLDLELERVRRYGKPAALLMLDLDHFKQVNDQYGHAAGDAVLRHFVDLTQRRLRRVDIFGRIGGEEFCILLPGTDIDGARDFAEMLCRQVAVSACDAARAASPAIHYTVSIGVASCGDGQRDADAILAQADHALYQAKTDGRNRVVANTA